MSDTKNNPAAELLEAIQLVRRSVAADGFTEARDLAAEHVDAADYPCMVPTGSDPEGACLILVCETGVLKGREWVVDLDNETVDGAKVPETPAKFRGGFPSARWAVAQILHAGFPLAVTPCECPDSCEQAGFQSYRNGFLVGDALHLDMQTTRDNTEHSAMVTAWLAGYWRAHGQHQQEA